MQYAYPLYTAKRIHPPSPSYVVYACIANVRRLTQGTRDFDARMAVPSCSTSPLRWDSTQRRACPGVEAVMEWGTLTNKLPLVGSSRSNSSSPPPERATRLRRPREKTAQQPCIIPAPTPTCTPTPTPTVTPSNTPKPTPSRKAAHLAGTCRASSSSSSTSPVRLEATTVASRLPPVPAFPSHVSPSLDKAAGAKSACPPAAAGVPAAPPAARVRGAEKGDASPSGVLRDLAGPLGGQGASSRDGLGVVGKVGRAGGVAGDAGASRQPGPGGRPREGDANLPTAPSIESEVTAMFDESQGTLRLSRNTLGDERVPSLSLERLKNSYRTRRGGVRSWTTAGMSNEGHGKPVPTALVEVEHGRLGVLSSTDAYLFHFKESRPPSPCGGSSSSSSSSDVVAHLAGVDEAGDENDPELQLVYVWIGRDAGVEACAAARAQGKRLLKDQPPTTPSTPLLEVEQGQEPALFLALFSYMLPPLAVVVLQGHDQTPDVRVLELQESPCLPGSGIVIAVEGPCSASLLAKHGPLPDRSYICLVRPRSRRVGSANEKGGVDFCGGERVGTFDEGYYWHGVGETAAVEGVGILLCQQVDRMFPSPSPLTTVRGKRKGSGRRRRGIGGAGLFGGMMRGFVADIKVGLPVPDGFWECVLPEGSPSDSRRMLWQDLRPDRRSRAVRVFGVCAGSRKARQSFVWEVTTGGMPSQMTLSPSLSHVVDAGGSCVYVWHGNGSNRDGRSLAVRVARVYAARVEGGASVEQVDAGSEPVGLLNCFIGWNQALVEPPPMPLLSPGRTPSQPGSSADLSPLTTPTTTASDAASWPAEGNRSAPTGCRTSSGRGASSSSASSCLRLTPPGQRTPPVTLSSPPSLKCMAGRVHPPPPPRRCATAAVGGVTFNSEAFSTPPRDRGSMTCVPIPGCNGGSFSPISVLGLASGVDGLAVDVSSNRLPNGSSGASSPVLGFAASAPDGPSDNWSSSDALCSPPRPASCASGGRAFSGERGQAGSCAAGAPTGKLPRNAGHHQCVDGQGEGASGNGKSQRECPANNGRDEHQSMDGGEGGSGRDGDGGNSSGRESSEGGGGGSGDDGDGRGSDGSGNGAQDGKVHKNAEDVDDDEAEECDSQEETDTFLRLSDVEFCEGVGTLESGGASSELSVTSNEAFGTSTGGGRSGGGVENGTALSRHLSDFFRSPLSLDSPPLQRFSSIRSLSDVQTGARLFDSVRSVRSEDDKSSRKSGSGNLSDSVSYVRAFGATTGDTADDVSTDLGVGVIVDGEESPRCSPPPAVSDPAASLPGPLSPQGGATNDYSTPPPPIPAKGTEGVLVKENVDPFPKAAADPVLEEHLLVSAAVAAFKSLDTAEGEQEPAAGLGDEGGGGGGGGRESEEEWLSHPEEEADTAPAGPGDWIERALEVTLASKRAEAAPQCAATSRAGNPEAAAAVADGERGGEEDAGAGAGHEWAGLNDDGSWRTEVARRAAGEAGAVEAERRRLAKVKADESWRSDAAGEGHGAPRRDSVSFTQLQTGNVRDKLNVFEGASGSKVGKEKPGNRSSVGALHGRGLVTAWAKKTTDHHPASTAINEQDSSGRSPPPPWSTGGRTRSPPPRAVDSDEQEEFTWKAGPSPCRPKGRPSLGLIRNGQVRIMSKALLMSCPEGGRETNTNHGGSRLGGSLDEPPMPSTPPPPLPASIATPPPLPARTSLVGVNPTRPLPARPTRASGSGSGSGSISAGQRPAAAKGNMWLAKAGLTRKNVAGSSSPPPAPPRTPPRESGSWRRGGGTPTHLAGGRAGGGMAAARAKGASGAWAKLHRRLEEESKNFNGKRCAEVVPPVVTSG